MYECLICDRRFHEFDVQVDEFGGKKAVCPYCKGEIEDLYECKVCGGLYSDDELESGVCRECIDKHTTFDNCIEFGNDCKVNVKINGFVAYVLSSEQINEILIREAKKANEIIPFETTEQLEFVASDTGWFAEQILKKERNKCQ